VYGAPVLDCTESLCSSFFLYSSRADGGRTPEYLGKKIEAFDVKMAMLTVLIYPLFVLVLPASRRRAEIWFVEPR